MLSFVPDLLKLCCCATSLKIPCSLMWLECPITCIFSLQATLCKFQQSHVPQPINMSVTCEGILETVLFKIGRRLVAGAREVSNMAHSLDLLCPQHSQLFCKGRCLQDVNGREDPVWCSVKFSVVAQRR